MSSIEGLVDEYGPKGQWKELGAVLDRMDRRRLAAGEQEMWYRARGIVEFRTNQRARATEIFEEGVRSFPTSGWLNYGWARSTRGRVGLTRWPPAFGTSASNRSGVPPCWRWRVTTTYGTASSLARS